MDLRIADLMFAHCCHWPCVKKKEFQESQNGSRESLI